MCADLSLFLFAFVARAPPRQDGYAPAPKRLAFADANPTPDPRTGQKKVYPTGKEFFPKANAGDTFPTAPIGHVRPKVPSFADLYPTTPAGIVNPSPKSFAQNNPVLLTGLMDPSVDPSKAEATFQVRGESSPFCSVCFFYRRRYSEKGLAWGVYCRGHLKSQF